MKEIAQRYGVTGGGSGDPWEFIPSSQRLALFQSKARVRIDKARESLGYEPRFGLESEWSALRCISDGANPDG